MDGILVEYTCAYCGEANETFVDPSAGLKQSYVEDCGICCHPNLLHIHVEPSTGDVAIEAAADE
jgi:hypothetical protein